MTSREYKEVVKNKIEQYARVNLLSPDQKKKLLKLKFDTDFIEIEVRKCLEKPDIQYLEKILIPAEAVSENNFGASASDVLQGIIMGDIIGSEYEFTEHDYSSVNAKTLTSSKSRFTDDSVLALATQKAIRKNPHKPDFRKAYINAYTEYPDVGYGGAYIRWARGEEISNRKGYNSYGNGSAVRAAIIGAEYEDVQDVIKQAIRSACVTHNHQYGIIGAAVTAAVIFMARRGYSKAEIERYASRFYHCDEGDLEFLLDKDMRFELYTEPDDVSNLISQNSLFCTCAVPLAIKYFIKTRSYSECMAEILRHYGDTDTLCAIAGGICAAYYSEPDISADDLARIYSVQQPLSI